MEEELLTFQKFKDADIATDVSEKLGDAGIYFEIESEDKFFDPSFAIDSLKNNFSIMIRPADFVKANKVLDEYYSSQIKAVSSDHYLFDFTNKELEEILEKPDEWGHLDYRMARDILKERGVEVNSERLEVLKEKRKYELSRPERSQPWLVILGYFIVAFSPFLNDLVRLAGFFVAFFLGWILRNMKKTLPDGETVYMYAPSDRRQGKIIMISAVLVFLAFIILLSLFGRFN